MTNKTIQAVVVLYGMRAEQSVALRTFMQYCHILHGDCHLCVYNNSSDIVVEFPEAEVVNAHENDGLAKAYNYALKRAQQNGSQWLLLLDQDTELTEAYFQSLDAFVSADQTDYIAAVPTLVQNGIHMSPAAYRPWKGVAWRCDSVTAAGVKDGMVFTAFNSGALMNVDKLQEMSGFNADFPLDMLDHWMFHQFHLKGWKTCVLDCELAHSLSENTGMNPERYRNYLQAHLHWAKRIGWTTALMFRFRMFLSWIQQILRHSDRTNRKFTWNIIFSKS